MHHSKAVEDSLTLQLKSAQQIYLKLETDNGSNVKKIVELESQNSELTCSLKKCQEELKGSNTRCRVIEEEHEHFVEVINRLPSIHEQIFREFHYSKMMWLKCTCDQFFLLLGIVVSWLTFRKDKNKNVHIAYVCAQGFYLILTAAKAWMEYAKTPVKWAKAVLVVLFVVSVAFQIVEFSFSVAAITNKTYMTEIYNLPVGTTLAAVFAFASDAVSKWLQARPS